MSRRRRWRASIQAQQNQTTNPHSTSVSAASPITSSAEVVPLPIRELKRVGIIVVVLFALLGSTVYVVHRGSNSSLLSQHIARLLHISS